MFYVVDLEQLVYPGQIGVGGGGGGDYGTYDYCNPTIRPKKISPGWSAGNKSIFSVGLGPILTI